MTDTATKEGREKRIEEIINDHAVKSKSAGDHHHKMAVKWGASDDYTEADHGEAPKGAQW